MDFFSGTRYPSFPVSIIHFREIGHVTPNKKTKNKTKLSIKMVKTGRGPLLSYISYRNNLSHVEKQTIQNQQKQIFVVETT